MLSHYSNKQIFRVIRSRFDPRHENANRPDLERAGVEPIEAVGQRVSEHIPKYLQVASWNINRLAEKVVVDAVAGSQMRDAHILALQEVVARDGKIPVLDALREQFGWYYVFAPEFFPRNGKFGDIQAVGNALLSPYPLTETRSYWLNGGCTQNAYNVDFLGGGHTIEARVGIPGNEVRAKSCHLELFNSIDGRAEQMEKVVDGEGRAIIAGDFNFVFRKDDKRAREYAEAKGFGDAAGDLGLFTMNDPYADLARLAGVSKGSLDRIFSKGFASPGQAFVLESIRASDHIPLIISYRLRA
jgi:endonuclease/exonuclease/phosphatase family metal-dependent hydrolase